MQPVLLIGLLIVLSSTMDQFGNSKDTQTAQLKSPTGVSWRWPTPHPNWCIFKDTQNTFPWRLLRKRRSYVGHWLPYRRLGQLLADWVALQNHLKNLPRPRSLRRYHHHFKRHRGIQPQGWRNTIWADNLTHTHGPWDQERRDWREDKLETTVCPQVGRRLS